MITFKKLDLVLQLIGLAALGICWIAFFTEGWLNLWAYFALGGWQLASFTIHLFAEFPGTLAASRRTYAFCVTALVALNLLLIPVWIIGLVGALVLSPLLAIFYARISYVELYRLRMRFRTQLR